MGLFVLVGVVVGFISIVAQVVEHRHWQDAATGAVGLVNLFIFVFDLIPSQVTRRVAV